MNIPNALTCLRIVLGVLCAMILARSDSALSYFIYFILFVFAAFTDLFDGYFARKLKIESSFGKIADPIADKILNLASFFVLSYRGVFSVWWLVPITIREVLVTAIRIERIMRGQVIAAEFAGKLKTTVQYVAIGMGFFVLIANTWAPESLVELLLKVVFFVSLVSTLILTLYSGIIFLIKIYHAQA